MIIFRSFLPFGRNIGRRREKEINEIRRNMQPKNAAERPNKKPKWWAFNESLDIIYCRLHVGVIQEEQGIQKEKCQPLQDPQLVPFTIIKYPPSTALRLCVRIGSVFFFFFSKPQNVKTERVSSPLLYCLS